MTCARCFQVISRYSGAQLKYRRKSCSCPLQGGARCHPASHRGYPGQRPAYAGHGRDRDDGGIRAGGCHGTGCGLAAKAKHLTGVTQGGDDCIVIALSASSVTLFACWSGYCIRIAQEGEIPRYRSPVGDWENMTDEGFVALAMESDFLASCTPLERELIVRR